MAQADTIAYSNAMFGLRKAQETARYVTVQPWVRGYYDCAQLPLGPLIVDVDAQVLDRVVFPKAYFLWAQDYVREAIKQKPPARASAEARVFWMLDVWAVMVQGLLALNVSDKTLGYHPVYGLLTVGNMLEPASALAAPFQAAYAELSKRLHDKKRAKAPAERLALKQWNASAIGPPPFMDLPFSWAHANREVQRRLFKLLPWTVGGVDSLKPTNDVAGPEYVWNRAADQWRLWGIQQGVPVPKFTGRMRTSVADWSYAKMYQDWWPQHMGQRTKLPELHQYVADVARETGAADLAWDGPLLRPNFAWSYANAGVLLNAFLGLDYEIAVSGQVAHWMAKAAPRDTQPKPGRYVPMPLTCDDWLDVKRNRIKAIKARSKAAVASPLIGVSNTAADVEKALKDIQEGLASFSATMAAVAVALPALAAAVSVAVPALASATAVLASVAAGAQAAGPIIGGIVAVMALLAMAIIAIGGVAEMYPPDPEGVPTFYVQPNPFLRTIRQRGYNTIASQGATGEAFVRTLDAIKNIEIKTRIHMGFYAGAWQPPKAVRVLMPVVTSVKLKTPKTPTPPKAVSPLDVCQQLFTAWAQSDARSSCLMAEDIEQAYALCQQSLAGKLSQTELLKRFDALVVAACARLKPPKPSILDAFLVGFSRSGNPFVREG